MLLKYVLTAKAKSLAGKAFYGYQNASNFGIQARQFSSKGFEDSAAWREMTKQQRINCALSEDEPQTAEMAYCRGLGFKSLGPEYYSDATNSFERSAVLDKSFAPLSLKQIAQIYTEIGDNLAAFDSMEKAFNNLWNLDPKDFEITKKIEIDYSSSLAGKEISYSVVHQAKEEISDKLLGKDPNVVSIGTAEERDANGNKTGNYVVEVGVIKLEGHAISNEYTLYIENGTGQKEIIHVRVCVVETGIIYAQDEIKKKYPNEVTAKHLEKISRSKFWGVY